MILYLLLLDVYVDLFAKYLKPSTLVEEMYSHAQEKKMYIP